MELAHVSKYYDIPVVDDVSLTIPKGKLTAFIGPNGAGKSTVISLMSRLLQKDGGTITLGSKPIESWQTKELAKEISVLKQMQSIQVSLTVEEFVAFGRFPYSGGKLTTDDHRKIDEAIRQTHLMDFRQRPLQTLSGGQLQRAFITLVLAQDTELILLDEPLNHLDMRQAYEVMTLLKRLVTELGKTIVIVMHDLNMAATFADYLVAFKKGKCVHQGTVDAIMQSDLLSTLYDIPLDVVTVHQKKICLFQEENYE